MKSWIAEPELLHEQVKKLRAWRLMDTVTGYSVERRIEANGLGR